MFQKLGEFPGQWACPREEPFAAVGVDPHCQDPEVSKPQPAWKCDGSRCQNATRFFRGFAAVDSGLNPVATDFGSALTRPSYFNTRWSESGRNSNGSLQSAWTTLFEASMISTSNVRVFNAYNRGDYVLRIDRPYHEGLPVVLLMIQAGVEPVSIPFIVAQLHSSTSRRLEDGSDAGQAVRVPGRVRLERNTRGHRARWRRGRPGAARSGGPSRSTSAITVEDEREHSGVGARPDRR